jgi:hypothetical protein
MVAGEPPQGGGLLRVATMARVPLPRRDSLIGSHTQPQRMASPIETGFAPAGQRLEIIGAVDEVSPFPVANGRRWSANSPETTPRGGLAGT